MPGASRHCPRIDIFELKHEIERKIGKQKAEKYFNLLSRYINLKLSKSEFNQLCVGLVGRENISLHNRLIRAIITNASVAKTPPEKYSKADASLSVKLPNGYPRSSLQSLCRDVFTQSPRKGRTPNLRDRKCRDRPSPLGPHGKTHNNIYEDSAIKVPEQQSATELLSLGSRPPVEVNSVEEGEEVEQAAESPGIHSRSPVTAPLGISLRGTKKVLSHGTASLLHTETCHSTGALPDMNSLKKRLEQKLVEEGLQVSTDCINLLNNGLDVFMKRLIKPCLEMAASRSEYRRLNLANNHQGISVLNGMRPMRSVQRPNKPFSASMLDFRVAMELNPRLLGEDWPLQLEKISMCGFEDSMAG